jgi:hypothetical protein
MILWHEDKPRLEEQEMVIAKQRLGKHAPVARDMQATMEELLEAMFSMQFIQRLYNESQQGP